MTAARLTIDKLTPLDKHVKRFVDKNKDYSPQTVAGGLNTIHSSTTSAKGTVISSFNATHSSDNIICPVLHGRFVKDEKSGYAKHLHLGTTRIWNPDGSVNEANWQKFVAFTVIVHDGKEIIPKSKLDAYLIKCYNEDPQESTTRRNTQSFFSSKYIQGTAATQAWNEVYDRLTCGWIEIDKKPNQMEPYITIEMAREFFDDSDKAFQLAEDKLLPIAKPILKEVPSMPESTVLSNNL